MIRQLCFLGSVLILLSSCGMAGKMTYHTNPQFFIAQQAPQSATVTEMAGVKATMIKIDTKHDPAAPKRLAKSSFRKEIKTALREKGLRKAGALATITLKKAGAPVKLSGVITSKKEVADKSKGMGCLCITAIVCGVLGWLTALGLRAMGLSGETWLYVTIFILLGCGIVALMLNDLDVDY